MAKTPKQNGFHFFIDPSYKGDIHRAIIEADLLDSIITLGMKELESMLR